MLLDLARFRGLAHLPPDTAMEPDELRAAADAAGVEVRAGDVVLFRTGWWKRFLEVDDATTWHREAPGLSWRCAEWLHDRKVAAVACDNSGVEPHGEQLRGVSIPLHMLVLRDMGMMLGELWNLEALADDCDSDRVFEFLLVAQPLHIPGAVGSPVNPLAIK